MAARATFDPARELEFFLRINRDGVKTLNFLDSGGAQYDLTGRTFVLNFKWHARESENFLQLTSTAGLTINQYSIGIAITKAQAAMFREQSYYWELVMTKNTLEKNWLTGNAWFHNGKFDGVGNTSDDLIIYDNGEIINITIAESGSGSGSSPVIDFSMTSALPTSPTAGDRRRIVLPSPYTPVLVGNVVYNHFQIIEYVGPYWIAYSNNTSDM